MGFGTCFVVVLVTILYLFAWIEDLSKKTKWKKRPPPKLPNPNNRNPEIQRVANDAVFTARNKFGVILDFTYSNLNELERLLQKAHEQYKLETYIRNSVNVPIDHHLDHSMTTWGSY
jgi:hypothetical protein